MRTVKIRHADTYDATWMLEQLRGLDGIYKAKKSMFGDTNKALANLHLMIDQHVAFVAERDNESLGFIAGFVGPHPYNNNIRVLTETFWWVVPEHRASRAAVLLFNAFVSWGRENVDWISMTLLTGTPANPDALTRRGFKEVETSYLMEI